MVFERQGHWTESRIVIRDLRDFFSVHVMICMWSYSRKSQPQMLNGKFPLSALCRVVAESEASQPVSPGLWLVCSYDCSVLIGCLQHCRARTADSLGCNWPVTTTRRRTPGPECANHKSVHEPDSDMHCAGIRPGGNISHVTSTQSSHEIIRCLRYKFWHLHRLHTQQSEATLQGPQSQWSDGVQERMGQVIPCHYVMHSQDQEQSFYLKWV